MTIYVNKEAQECSTPQATPEATSSENSIQIQLQKSSEALTALIGSCVEEAMKVRIPAPSSNPDNGAINTNPTDFMEDFDNLQANVLDIADKVDKLEAKINLILASLTASKITPSTDATASGTLQVSVVPAQPQVGVNEAERQEPAPTTSNTPQETSTEEKEDEDSTELGPYYKDFKAKYDSYLNYAYNFPISLVVDQKSSDSLGLASSWEDIPSYEKEDIHLEASTGADQYIGLPFSENEEYVMIAPANTNTNTSYRNLLVSAFYKFFEIETRPVGAKRGIIIGRPAIVHCISGNYYEEQKGILYIYK